MKSAIFEDLKITPTIDADLPTHIIKRDGSKEPFNIEKIRFALHKCYTNSKITPGVPISKTVDTISLVIKNSTKFNNEIPHIEQIQDIVEFSLLSNKEYDAAKHYILYREEHNKIRQSRPIPKHVKDEFDKADEYFPTPIQKFQFFDKYSRFDYEKGRRETWIETVTRSVDYLKELSENKLEQSVYDRIYDGILNMRIMPSMRLLAMAGAAARRNNISLYNCSFVPIDTFDSIVEALIISMNGCGVGFSVERYHIEKLPRIKRQTGEVLDTFVVPDTADGWADALRLGLNTWSEGKDIKFDLSLLRPFGAPLKTKGGRSSGPEPLRKLLRFIREKMLSRQGSFLSSLDAHDIVCVVGEASISGGVRRTALISLFDFDDKEMLHCKDGDLTKNPQRWSANNSAVWPDRRLTQEEILNFMNIMIQSGRGEPGIFNRRAAFLNATKRRLERGMDPYIGTNPCGEVLLYENFCNLTSVVSRSDDTVDTLIEKVELATIIGTIQSSATHFPGLRKQWEENSRRERLLGVDLNGQMDCVVVQKADVQAKLKQHAVWINEIYAEKLGIEQSVAVTTVKPSGNSSQLLNSASGIHARWANYYIRNIRINTGSPLFKVMKDEGVPMHPENGQIEETATSWVIHFPVKSPKGAITRNGRSAIEQCEYWKQVRLNYTEHNPSITVTYKPDEVIDIVKWVYENQDIIGGISFLPSFDAQYDQMPYEEITKEEYEVLIEKFPEVDFSKVYRYETEDLTTASQELACLGAACDMDL